MCETSRGRCIGYGHLGGMGLVNTQRRSNLRGPLEAPTLMRLTDEPTAGRPL